MKIERRASGSLYLVKGYKSCELREWLRYYLPRKACCDSLVLFGFKNRTCSDHPTNAGWLGRIVIAVIGCRYEERVGSHMRPLTGWRKRLVEAFAGNRKAVYENGGWVYPLAKPYWERTCLWR